MTDTDTQLADLGRRIAAMATRWPAAAPPARDDLGMTEADHREIQDSIRDHELGLRRQAWAQVWRGEAAPRHRDRREYGYGELMEGWGVRPWVAPFRRFGLRLVATLAMALGRWRADSMRSESLCWWGAYNDGYFCGSTGLQLDVRRCRVEVSEESDCLY